MSCVKLLATASNLLRKAGELSASAGRLIKRGKASGWKQAINQMAVVYAIPRRTQNPSPTPPSRRPRKPPLIWQQRTGVCAKKTPTSITPTKSCEWHRLSSRLRIPHKQASCSSKTNTQVEQIPAKLTENFPTCVSCDEGLYLPKWD